MLTSKVTIGWIVAFAGPILFLAASPDKNGSILSAIEAKSVIGFSITGPPCTVWFPEWNCIQGTDSYIDCGFYPGVGCEGDNSGFYCDGEDMISFASTINAGQGFTGVDKTTVMAACGQKRVAGIGCFYFSETDSHGVIIRQWCEAILIPTGIPCNATEEVKNQESCTAGGVAV